jgi:hypothetical protein
MRDALRSLLEDEAMAAEIAAHGRRTILARHTCAHRVDQLLAVYREAGGPVPTAVDEDAAPEPEAAAETSR